MEKSKQAAEENPSAISSGSIIQISSIFIELPLSPPEMDPTHCCDHKFSIRGFSFAKRSSNQKFSSLFPMTDDSNDKELPPMETPRHRYWRCPECCCKEMEKAEVQLGTTTKISEGMRPIGTGSRMQEILVSEDTEGIQSVCTNAGIQQVLVPENTEGIQSAGTNPGSQQVLLPKNSKGIQSISTSLGMQQGPSEGTSKDSRSFATISEIQHSSTAQTTECIQSIGTNVGKQKDQTGSITEGMRSIITNGNTVESSAFLPCTQKITSAQAADISCTGDKNAPTEPTVDIIEKLPDERIKTKTSRVTTGGSTEVPAEKMINSGGISSRGGPHKSAIRNKRVVPPEKDKVKSVEQTANGTGKIDETENDRCRENENVNGNPKRKVRKVRLMTDLLGDKGNSTVNTTERISSASPALLESAAAGNATLQSQVGSEKEAVIGVQSPRKKAKVVREGEETNDPSNVGSNVKTKNDTGKEIMVIDVPDSDVNNVPSGGEGLFIGTKTERMRRRSEIIPSVSKKRNKHTEVLDFSSPSFVTPLPTSAAGSWGSHPSSEQRDQNHASLLSTGLNSLPSLSRPAKVGLDLSLGSFQKRNHSQDNGSKVFLNKDNILFGGSNTVPTPELNRSGTRTQSLDLNERAALIPSNPEMNKLPGHKETDFLKLGLKRKRTEESDDDFPKDIVELLAKNQHDKKISDADVIPVVQNSNDAPSRFFDVDAVGTTKNSVRGYPGLHGIPPVETQQGASEARENGRIHQGHTVTFPHLSKSHMKLFQTEENRKSIYTASAPNLQKPPSGIQISPSAAVRAGFQHIQALEPLSSPTQAFGFGIQQKQAGEQHKGKTISDIKLDELKRSEEARFNNKPGGLAIGSKSKGTLDANKYNNDSIPALQLLSLMDGRPSGTTFSLDTTKIVDKPFSPCSYHPGFSRDGRQELTKASLFLHQPPTRESPILGPTLSSYQNSRPQPAAPSGHLSFLTPHKEFSQNKSQNPGSSGGTGPTSRRRDKPKAITNGANTLGGPQAYPTPYQRYVNSRQPILEAIVNPTAVARSGSARQISADGVCRTNRNPADFSVPEAGNMYTICGKDLRSRKRKPYTRRTVITTYDDIQSQRNKKGKPGDEPPKDGASGGKVN